MKTGREHKQNGPASQRKPGSLLVKWKRYSTACDPRCSQAAELPLPLRGYARVIAASVGTVSPPALRALTPMVIGTPVGGPVKLTPVGPNKPASVAGPLLPVGFQVTR
jgi:hypothetical protein